MSRAKFTDFENCTLNNIDWMSLQGDGAFADPIESLRDCRLKYNTFTEMNLTKFKFAGSVIQRSMFAKCNLVSADFEKCDLLDTEFFQCDMRKILPAGGSVAAGRFEDQIAVKNIQIEKLSNAYTIRRLT